MVPAMRPDSVVVDKSRPVTYFSAAPPGVDTVTPGQLSMEVFASQLRNGWVAGRPELAGSPVHWLRMPTKNLQLATRLGLPAGTTVAESHREDGNAGMESLSAMVTAVEERGMD